MMKRKWVSFKFKRLQYFSTSNKIWRIASVRPCTAYTIQRTHVIWIIMCQIHRRSHILRDWNTALFIEWTVRAKNDLNISNVNVRRPYTVDIDATVKIRFVFHVCFRPTFLARMNRGRRYTSIYPFVKQFAQIIRRTSLALITLQF